VRKVREKLREKPCCLPKEFDPGRLEHLLEAATFFYNPRAKAMNPSTGNMETPCGFVNWPGGWLFNQIVLTDRPFDGTCCSTERVVLHEVIHLQWSHNDDEHADQGALACFPCGGK
jgi:hypothetical protein